MMALPMRVVCPFCLNNDPLVADCPECEGKGMVTPKQTAEANAAIPDSADLSDLKAVPDDPRGGIDTPGPHAPNTIPDSASSFIKPIFTPEEWKEIMQEVEIVPVREGDKYIILLKSQIEPDTIELVGRQLSEFWEDPQRPFMLMGPDYQLVKVDPNAEIPMLASCGHEECPGHEPGSAEECEIISLK